MFHVMQKLHLFQIFFIKNKWFPAVLLMLASILSCFSFGQDTKLDWKTSTQSNTTLSVQNLSNFKVGVSCSANLFHSSLANLSHSSPANLSHSSLEESMVVGGGMWWSNCKYPEETGLSQIHMQTRITLCSLIK